MASDDWKAIVDCWDDEDPELVAKLQQVAQQPVPANPNQNLGSLPEFAHLVQAIDRLRARQADADIRQVLAEIILQRRYDAVLNSISGSLNDQLVIAVFKYLNDDKDVNWLGPGFATADLREIAIMSLEESTPERDEVVQCPPDMTPAGLKEVLAVKQNRSASSFNFRGSHNNLRLLQDHVLVVTHRQTDWRQDVASWPQCQGRERLVDLVEFMQRLLLATSPDGTWGGTGEFADIVDVLTEVLTTSRIPRSGSKWAQDHAQDYAELAETLEKLLADHSATPQSVLTELKDEFGVV